MDRLALKKELQEQGLIILPGFFDPQLIGQIQQAAKAIFDIQFKRFGIQGDYLTQMQSLFVHHL